MGKKQKKFMQEKVPRKKIHAKKKVKKKNPCKEEGKEKKFMQKECPVVTFSDSLSFFQKV